MNDEIMVSICCLTYNQEKYIRQTLDGFLMQECDFKYEIIIHDDASTDNTPSIIKEYELKYPDIIKPIYQSENQYSQGTRILLKYVYPQITGKYFSICEGDDYWCDFKKLQKQFDALENNHDCCMCIHTVQAIKENGDLLDLFYPDYHIGTGVITTREILDYICTNKYVFQTSSYFGKSECMFRLLDNTPDFYTASSTGDTPLLLFFAAQGNFFFLDNIMSRYRHDSSSSVERRNNYNDTEEKIVKWFNKQIDMMKKYDKYTGHNYHDLCQRKINGYHFDRALRNNNYKELLKSKYRFFLRDYSFKSRVYIFIKGIKSYIISG